MSSTGAVRRWALRAPCMIALLAPALPASAQPLAQATPIANTPTVGSPVLEALAARPRPRTAFGAAGIAIVTGYSDPLDAGLVLELGLRPVRQAEFLFVRAQAMFERWHDQGERGSWRTWRSGVEMFRVEQLPPACRRGSVRSAPINRYCVSRVTAGQ